MIAAPSCWVFCFVLQMLIFNVFVLQIRKNEGSNISYGQAVQIDHVFAYICLLL